MPTQAHTVLDRAVMIASRRERNFEPSLVTAVLHTTSNPVYLEGTPCPHCPGIPAPDWPELHLPRYTFTRQPVTGLYPATSLDTFTRILDQTLGDPGTSLTLTIHADVPDHDLDDAYAWRYDRQTNDFRSVPPADATPLLHEDTTVLAYPWDKAPWASVSAFCQPEAHPADLAA